MSDNTKYTYDEILFVVEEAYNTYANIFDQELRSKFPMRFKKAIFQSFIAKFGQDHPFHSVKMLIDNVLANWKINGYLKFSKGSNLVQEISTKMWDGDIKKIKAH